MILALFLRIFGPFIDYMATKHRPLCMLVVVCPISFLLRTVMGIRDWCVWKWSGSCTPAQHEAKVARVVAAVQQRNALPEAERKMMCTARAPWQNLSTRFADYKANSNCIYVGDLRGVIHLDEEAETVHIEPLVTVGQITRQLVPQGWMLATTLEIDEATVGGLAMAVGMTTASHKYGLLQETVTEYEVVLGDGSLVKASKEENAELYYALPWSHGSLGLLVGLTLKVIKVKPYVAVEYKSFNDAHPKDYSDYIRDVSLEEDAADFVEATVYRKNQCVVMTGRFADVTTSEQRAKVNSVGWWWKPWYYVHVRGFLAQSANDAVPVEYIPTLQYIFRHNRAIFWTVRDQIPEWIGNNVFIRFFMGWMFPPLVTFLKLPATPAIKHEMMNHRVYQDIVLPVRTIEPAIERSADLFGIWPILVYPSRVYDHGPGKRGLFPTPEKQDIVPGTNYAMYYDLGVYGIPRPVREGRPDEYKAVATMRKMEHYVRSVSGAPFLYADTFLKPEEFTDMFNMELYNIARKKFKAEGNFPTVYQKTTHSRTVDQLLADEMAYKKNK